MPTLVLRSGWPVLSDSVMRLTISVQPPPAVVMSQYAGKGGLPPGPSGSMLYTPFPRLGFACLSAWQLTGPTTHWPARQNGVIAPHTFLHLPQLLTSLVKSAS